MLLDLIPARLLDPHPSLVDGQLSEKSSQEMGFTQDKDNEIRLSPDKYIIPST